MTTSPKVDFQTDRSYTSILTESTRQLLKDHIERDHQLTKDAFQQVQDSLKLLLERQEQEQESRKIYNSYIEAMGADFRTPYQTMVENDTAYEELHRLQREHRTKQLEQDHIDLQLEQHLEHLEQDEQDRVDLQLEQHLEQDRDLQLEQHLEQRYNEQQQLEKQLEKQSE